MNQLIGKAEQPAQIKTNPRVVGEAAIIARFIKEYQKDFTLNDIVNDYMEENDKPDVEFDILKRLFKDLADGMAVGGYLQRIYQAVDSQGEVCDTFSNYLEGIDSLVWSDNENDFFKVSEDNVRPGYRFIDLAITENSEKGIGVELKESDYAGSHSVDGHALSMDDQMLIDGS